MSPTPVWHNLPVGKILEILKTKRTGLTEEQARRRLQKIGLNQLPEEKQTPALLILINQFKSPLVYVLLFACLVSLFLKNWVDFLIISVVVIINALIGFIQENKASQAIFHLKKLIKFKARVLRNNQEKEIGVEYLVPGDIIILEAGDKVPADARLFETQNLKTVEAALTGESEPSEKNTKILDKGTILADRENMVYLGTTMMAGVGKAVVCETGISTQMGKIATLIKETPEEKTPLQLQLNKFSQLLTFVILAICFLIILMGIFRGLPFFSNLERQQEGIFYVAVALAVSAIPEGLLVAITVVLALGMQVILKQKALVKKLLAAETLGSTSVICTDKTGTITEGKMQVSQIITFSGEFPFNREGVKLIDGKTELEHFFILKIAALCNNAFIENPDEPLKDWRVVGDPTETALLLAAIQAGINKNENEKKQPRLAEIPFDSEKKLMATRHQLTEENQVIYVKGAPEVILFLCSQIEIEGKAEKLTSEKLENLNHQYENLTRQGLRLLAFAYKKIKPEASLPENLNQLTFVGFIALKDPIRPEAVEALKLCKMAGIKTIIITGDHQLTAKAIGQEIGLPTEPENILEGKDLDKLDDQVFNKAIKNITIYARVNPEHKLRIIDAWQKRGEVVAMTGDGVNDAPALKAADIGIALGSGTDVAKETADIILLDNNFRTITAAVRQGRIIFDNIRKVILYLLAGSFSEIILVAGSLIFGLPLPIIPAQILWINLISDSFPAMAMTVEPGEPEIMNDQPRQKDEPIINRKIKILIFIVGVVVNFTLFIIFIWLLKLYGIANISYIRTVIFSVLSLYTLFYVFSIKSLRHSIFSKNIFSNQALIWSVLLGIGLQLLAVYEPHLQKILKTTSLPLADWLIIVIFSLIGLVAIEIAKYFFIHHHRKYRC